MFAISLFWPRNDDNTFKHSVYLWLSKKKPDLYNITDIILLLEKFFEFKYVGAVIAICLCIGGNDFLPNFHSVSHDYVLTTVTTDRNMLSNLVNFNYTASGDVTSIVEEVYLKMIKKLYCPKNLNDALLSMEDVRQMSVKLPNKNVFKHPQSWMPPESALRKLCRLTQCQIDYLMTSYNHSAELPDFLASGCLLKSNDGDIIYNLGENIHTDDKASLLVIPEDQLTARIDQAKLVKRRSKNGNLL